MPDPYILAHTGAQLDESCNRPISIAGGGTGQTTRYTNITVTNDSTTVTSHNILARAFMYINMGFLRATVLFDNVAVEANTWVPIATVPAEYKPTYTTALTVDLVGAASGTVKPAQARIKNDGTIEIGVGDALLATSDYYAYVSGWWTLPA